MFGGLQWLRDDAGRWLRAAVRESAQDVRRVVWILPLGAPEFIREGPLATGRLSFTVYQLRRSLGGGERESLC